MIKSRLIRLYLSLDKPALRQLKNWINSPVHNQHLKSTELFDFLITRKKINKTTVDKKRCFKYLYGQENYDEKKINILMSYCFKILTEFIGYLSTENEKYFMQNLTIKYLSNRNMPKIAESILCKSEASLNAQPLQNAQESLWRYQIEKERLRLSSNKTRTDHTTLEPLFGHLNNFYVISMLKHACLAASQHNMSQQEYKIDLLQEVLQQATQNKHPVVQLYLNSYQTLSTSNNTVNYENTAKQFIQHNEYLDKDEKREILLILINYSIKKLNTGADEFRRKAFDWYKLGLDNHLLIKEQHLSRFAYSNIASLGLQLKEFEWVADFIPKYALKLEEQHRENYIHYTRAKLYFNQKKYARTQQLLSQIEYEDIFLNLDAKTMLLEIYYEERSYDALEALLQSFSRYLQRKSVMAYHKEVYKNIIFLIRKMLDIAPYDKKALEKLKQQVENTQPLVERHWLLQQIELLT